MGPAPDSRRLQRVARLNALFSWDFYGTVGGDFHALEPSLAESESLEPFPLTVPDGEDYSGTLLQPELLAPILEHITEIDSAIFRFAPKHDLAHFNKVDLAILRQALYELLYTSTPAAVVIDEAIELAKLYASEEAPSFVHGVLGNVADERKKAFGQEATNDKNENS